MKILITGTSGFIGFHLAKLLLKEDLLVTGYDGMTDYYDVQLKKNRNKILCQNSNFTFKKGMLENQSKLENLFDIFRPDIVIHLAAQAGVRYSLENPKSYIDSNIIGTFNILEMTKKFSVKHLLIASTSSVYGANLDMPFHENLKSDTQISIYAATKKANENMAHSYSYTWKIPITVFRFFTVYGPWGRPDMALFKFVSAILEERQIDIYNDGKMYRDFTYVDDLVLAVRKLMDIPPSDLDSNYKSKNDSLSPVAPYRIVNIGNSKKIKLLDFIDTIELVLQKKSKRNYKPMQIGDVPMTWADVTLLQELTGFQPNTDYKKGIELFVNWYRDYYNV